MTLDGRAFRYVQQLVRDRAAIVLDDGKHYLVETRLSQLARRENLTTAQDVVDRLRAAPHGPLQRKVVEAMTTTETLFFRDARPYDALANTVLPALVRARARTRRLRLWSCACSSGQEPYSLAMLLREQLPARSTWAVRIVATDISSEMLARARAGVYSALEVSRGLPRALLAKYFTPRGGDWEIRAELRAAVDFRELNLAAPSLAMEPVDVVMLRNVLIYFDVDTKRRILARVRAAMQPGGAMFLGTAETTTNLAGGFELTTSDGATYYRTCPA